MLRVLPVPVYDDNYSYVLAVGGRAVVVDPAEAGPVLDVLALHGLGLESIWCTHHHGDHVGGVVGLVAALGAVPVYASGYDLEKKRVPLQSVAVGGPDQLEQDFVWAGLDVRALYVPGHTLGAVAFWVRGPDGESELFAGDTLFLGGCGRLFEGTAAMMRASLTRLRALPGDTRLWVGHEYTEKNLRFAEVVEPDNVARQQRQARFVVPSIPGTIEEERATNPFLRWEALSQSQSPEDWDREFARIRELRNHF